MSQQFNNHIDDLPQKLLFLAAWPDVHTPEIWTLSDIERVFGSSGEIMYYIHKMQIGESLHETESNLCLLYTSPSPRDLSTSRMPSSA